MKTATRFVWILAFFCMTLWIGWSIWRAFQSYNFEVACGGHLKRAADANNVELAKQELEVALKYMNEHNLTKGNTAVMFPTPATDVEFWHNNLSDSLKDLKNVSSDATPLEKSNLLMKLRETLIDHGEKGDHVTVPASIDVFPNVAAQFWFSQLTGYGAIFFGLLAAITLKLED